MAKVINCGLRCDSCQEDVNVHGCYGCEQEFVEGDEVICVQHSQSDCEHYHKGCRK